ncbi:MAG: class I SAM-dependent methyltransferase [Planctomycetes bacterium]|nr:class I SAM-dependent methyltransferase [Planctomycetota bacterium]
MFQGISTKHTQNEKSLFEDYSTYFRSSPLPEHLKLSNFAKYVRRQDLSRFLAKNELFKLQVDIPGSIVECGCFAGGGLMTFAQLSSIYEPFNHQRKVIGFDTFKGFPSTHQQDRNSETKFKRGDLAVHKDIKSEIEKAIELHDRNRPVSHVSKTELIAGDAIKTIPKYLKDNPHLVVSLLYLDFDLFEPTKVALNTFFNRMPKGALLAFDELNTKSFPGETLALLETLGIGSLRLKKTVFDPYISFAQI